MQSGRAIFALSTAAKKSGEKKPPVSRALAVSIQEVCHEEASTRSATGKSCL